MSNLIAPPHHVLRSPSQKPAAGFCWQRRLGGSLALGALGRTSRLHRHPLLAIQAPQSFASAPPPQGGNVGSAEPPPQCGRLPTSAPSNHVGQAGGLAHMRVVSFKPALLGARVGYHPFTCTATEVMVCALGATTVSTPSR